MPIDTSEIFSLDTLKIIEATENTPGGGGAATSSGEKTSSAVIKASAGSLCGILMLTDGVNDTTIILYDNASAASGTKLWEAKVPATDEYGGCMFTIPVAFDNGCYISIAGTGASAIVFYV